jgi:hypothetical protein
LTQPQNVIEGRAMSETWKIAAILAADAVGYSRLMGEDEAGTARGTETSLS